MSDNEDEGYRTIFANDEDGLSHKELMQVTSSALAELLSTDKLLSDLPKDATLEEVKAQIAVEYGQSMTVYVVREDNKAFPIVVPQGTATVRELKNALQRYMSLYLTRQNSTKSISWRHVWRTHWLCYDHQVLSDDKKLLSSYNIYNKCRLAFVKRVREKGSVKVNQ